MSVCKWAPRSPSFLLPFSDRSYMNYSRSKRVNLGWRIRYGSSNTIWDYLQYLKSHVLHGGYTICFYQSPVNNLGVQWSSTAAVRQSMPPSRQHPETLGEWCRTGDLLGENEFLPECSWPMVQSQTSCYITGQAGALTKKALARDEILLMNSLVFQVDLSPSQVQVKCL